MQKSYKKTGLLAITLILPVFIFLFLKFFGQNEYKLPYFGKKLLNGKDTIYYKTPETLEISQNKSVFLQTKNQNTIVFEAGNEEFKRNIVRFSTNKGLKNFVLAEIADTTILRKFLVKNPFQIALIDEKANVRGIYDGLKEEEIDRLIIEMRVLQDIYQKR
jgi:hypothetical protein